MNHHLRARLVSRLRQPQRPRRYLGPRPRVVRCSVCGHSGRPCRLSGLACCCRCLWGVEKCPLVSSARPRRWSGVWALLLLLALLLLFG